MSLKLLQNQSHCPLRVNHKSPVSPKIENTSSGSVTPQLAKNASENILLQDLEKMQSPQLPANLISTPEVQCVIVEHIVKSSEVASHSCTGYTLL